MTGTDGRPSGGAPIYDVITAQRACRSFRPEPVDPAVIRRVLIAATHAPSAENSQPWRFVVVTDPDRRNQIGALATKAWTSGARTHSEPHLTPAILADVDRSTTGGGIAAAPVVIVVCADPAGTFPVALPASVWPCVQNLLLAAAAEGLGAALTTLATLFPAELHELLDLPDDVTPYAVVPLGHPARPLGPPRRRPLDEVAFADRWGTPLG